MNRVNDHLMTVFSCALDCESDSERVAYLDRACGGDQALRAEVETLLRAHDEAGGFLEPMPKSYRLTDAQAEVTETVVPAPDPEIGAVLAGRYRLLEVIGEGGMGKVWQAEQTEPVQRTVALKVIKPGMDSKQVLARFEVERQALAVMDHPNIAKVRDGGTTQSHLPFFVMELVRGVPFTDYCDLHSLTLRARLEQFVEVCHAVQHAHQKGIIHRDLKPTNVLVAQYDGKPVPKVIDFGIAKAIGQPLTDKTLFTGLGGIVGTPEYMSPEQAELNNNDIDTRSDIYGLGVLLYELLTGTTPLSRQRSQATPLMEVLRVVRDEEPPKPSTRLSTVDELPTIAAHRGLEPKKLMGLVRGELDWIVMKALEKDRTRRYDTAAAFADDVQCYLDEEPVLAHPPTRRYRLRKFARRHRTALAMASVVAVALFLTVAGLAASTIIIDRKQRATESALNAEKEAKDELKKAVERERRNLYDYAFGMARRDWMAGDLDQARRYLETCPTELRDRDWEYLHRVCHAELVRIPKGATKLQFSPDGEYLAGVGPCMIWNATSGEEFQNLALLRFLFTFAGVAYSSDGNELIMATTGESLNFSSLAGKQAEHPGYSVTVWDLVNRKSSGGFVRKGLWGRAVLNRDGSRVVLMPYPPNQVFLADMAPPRWVAVYETRTGRELCNLAVPKDHLVDAVFHPNGQLLTVSAGDKMLRFWDVTTGQQTRTLSLGGYPLKRFVISPDGKRLAAFSVASKATHQVKVWDLQTAEVIAAFSGHTGHVMTLAFSPDGRRLATGGSDKAVMIWDVDAGKDQLVLRGHASGITDVTFSPNGSRVASSDSSANGTTRIWDLGRSQ